MLRDEENETATKAVIVVMGTVTGDPSSYGFKPNSIKSCILCESCHVPMRLLIMHPKAFPLLYIWCGVMHSCTVNVAIFSNIFSVELFLLKVNFFCTPPQVGTRTLGVPQVSI